eukprot:TRINITY_DN29838_c0_g1_i1.p1 TRINITY_DN29838_c0_g1~~TRINITY_DN29838_c0_g1_i1.p1  ORF type:complete len:228 (-),score=15.84 TRINITY_DN29838_c0_g1_i1:163-846(-)
MTDVTWPILINQFYCDKNTASSSNCKPSTRAVAVTNVRYNGVRGTCNGTNGVLFDCSPSVPCSGISLANVQLLSSRKPKSGSSSSSGSVSTKSAGSISSSRSIFLQTASTAATAAARLAGQLLDAAKGVADGSTELSPDVMRLNPMLVAALSGGSNAAKPASAVSSIKTSSSAAVSSFDLLAVYNNAYGSTDAATVSPFIAAATWKGAVPPPKGQTAIAQMAAYCSL